MQHILGIWFSRWNIHIKGINIQTFIQYNTSMTDRQEHCWVLILHKRGWNKKLRIKVVCGHCFGLFHSGGWLVLDVSWLMNWPWFIFLSATGSRRTNLMSHCVPIFFVCFSEQFSSSFYLFSLVRFSLDDKASGLPFHAL